jgi:hypothetical protein
MRAIDRGKLGQCTWRILRADDLSGQDEVASRGKATAALHKEVLGACVRVIARCR